MPSDIGIWSTEKEVQGGFAVADDGYALDVGVGLPLHLGTGVALFGGANWNEEASSVDSAAPTSEHHYRLGGALVFSRGDVGGLYIGLVGEYSTMEQSYHRIHVHPAYDSTLGVYVDSNYFDPFALDARWFQAIGSVGLRGRLDPRVIPVALETDLNFGLGYRWMSRFVSNDPDLKGSSGLAQMSLTLRLVLFKRVAGELNITIESAAGESPEWLGITTAAGIRFIAPL